VPPGADTCTLMAPSYHLMISCVLLFTANAALAATRKATPTPSPTEGLTTLRAERPQMLLSGKAGSLEARLVSVKVRNVGSNEARQIQVVLELDGGLALPLKGPKTLRAYGNGLYVSSARLPSVLYRAPHVALSCVSCRN
jgi:hypothetical protein